MASELTRRVAVAAVGIPAALVVLYLGGWALAAVLAGIAAAGAAELFRLARQRGVRPFAAAGAALAAAPVVLAAFHDTPARAAGLSWVLFLGAALALAAAAIFARGVAGAPLASAAITLFGALFVGGTLACAVFLRELPVAVEAGAERRAGAALLLFPLALTWISDTFAYFGGRAFGRRRLIPSVSPAKTVEGAVSGLLGTAAAGAVYAHLVFTGSLGLPIGALAGALAGLVLSPVAQIGDLAESLLKREAGVKDSGALLPGHGGVLDRFDSLFFSIPVAYALLAWLLRGSVG